MERMFAMNRYFSPKFIFAKVIFEKDKFTSKVYDGIEFLEGECWSTSGEVKDGEPVHSVPLDETRVLYVCFCCFFHCKRITV